jgi:two-component system nitrate/nitrite response regulator NarL
VTPTQAQHQTHSHTWPTGIAGQRIVIVEDHALLAQSLLLALRAHGASVQAIDLASTTDVVKACAEFAPQVILLDLDLGETIGDGVDLIGPLSRIGLVAILSGSTDDARLGSCLEAGAAGLIAKTTPLVELIGLVGRLAAGEDIVSTSRNNALLARLRMQRDERRRELLAFEALTERERDVLAALVQGRQVEEMTRELYVTETTVRTHVRAILRKLNVRSQLAAVAYAHHAGWQCPPNESAPARAGRGAA